VNPGFRTEHLVTFKVDVSPSLMKTASSARTAYQQLIERIRQIPGVEAADFTDNVPLAEGGRAIMPFWINSQKPSSLQGAPRVMMSLTGPDYIRTMGIPLLRGRFFTSEDTIDSPCVIVIDGILARTYFPESDPLGQTLSAGFSPVGPCRIVGVVGHVKQWQMDEPSTLPQNQAYFPLYQDPDKWVPLNYPSTSIVVRAPVDTATLVPSIKAAVYGASSDQPVYSVKTMQEIVSESMSSQRFPMLLLTAFAGLAVLLASTGIYAVISYSVTRRVHEIGIRMSLGAQRRNVLALILGEGARMAGLGVIIGIAASLGITRLMSSLLFGVSATDPLTFVVVGTLLSFAALLASYVPARRAMRVDPIVALRYE
jgi:predicted permease